MNLKGQSRKKRRFSQLGLHKINRISRIVSVFCAFVSWLMPLCSIFISVSCSCSGFKESGSSAKAESFPYVNVPSFIIEKDEIAKYMAQNYWNRYFKEGAKDTSVYFMDGELFVKAYADYAAILNAVVQKNYNVVESSQKKLFATADSLYQSGYKLLLMRLLSLSEKYLYDPNSPYLNEEAYIPALESVIALKSLDSIGKMPYIWQLDMALLNRVGQKAHDFDFVYFAGNNTLANSSLYEIKAEYTLVYFNNPDCNSCKEQLELLLLNPHLNYLSETGRLKVLSIYIDEQTELWEKHFKDVPSRWIYAKDASLVLRNNELYGIRAIPSMYLLDGDKLVILKDASAQKVLEYIERIGSCIK